jgi:tRNA U34 5-carboxymethylaminomethyl modifying GTPase MnmE/TrmE
MNLDDTIVAIATPPGRGGIGVVRLAGPKARAIACAMLRLKHELTAGCAVFGEVIEPATEERIDEAVVTFCDISLNWSRHAVRALLNPANSLCVLS